MLYKGLIYSSSPQLSIMYCVASYSLHLNYFGSFSFFSLTLFLINKHLFMVKTTDNKAPVSSLISPDTGGRHRLAGEHSAAFSVVVKEADISPRSRWGLNQSHKTSENCSFIYQVLRNRRPKECKRLLHVLWKCNLALLPPCFAHQGDAVFTVCCTALKQLKKINAVAGLTN